MNNKNVMTRTLALAGTVLVWFPIVAPILLGVVRFIQVRRFQVDYLMPAELAMLVLFGGAMLLWAALRLHAWRWLIGASLGSAVLLLVGSQALAVLTGLADGRIGMGGWQWALVLGMLVGYILAVIVCGVGGVLLVREMNKSGLPATKP
jgi:hypothetical protein